MVKTLDSIEEFNDAKGTTGNKLVVIDFFATWCGPCINIAPKIEELAKEVTGVDFYKVDVDVNGDAAESVGISAMPTFKFYKNGKEVHEIVGANFDKIKEAVNTHK